LKQPETVLGLFQPHLRVKNKP